jgi:hypothetical protein
MKAIIVINITTVAGGESDERAVMESVINIPSLISN